MEWFYLPVNAIVKGEKQYDWTALDAQLNAIAARGHQSVFRLYLDYPGRETGVPQYLIDEGIDTTRRYDDYNNNGISFSPDYDDPRIKNMMLDLVSALGQRYDGDPRIGFITQGLIGFWGEGHTYPMNGWDLPENWLANQDTLVALTKQWDSSFHKTRTLTRYPETWNAQLNNGYHDDSFGPSTLPTESWHFLSMMKSAGALDKWQTAPIGGEVYPDSQSCLFAATSCVPWMSYAIQQSHVSWLVNQQAFAPGVSGDSRQSALESEASMGYIMQVEKAGIKTELQGPINVDVVLKNNGVAPFYYSWPMDIALLNKAGNVVASTVANRSIDNIQPGQQATAEGTLQVEKLPKDTYELAVRVKNPVNGGVPVRFANRDQTTGSDGWLKVGDYKR